MQTAGEDKRKCSSFTRGGKKNLIFKQASVLPDYVQRFRNVTSCVRSAEREGVDSREKGDTLTLTGGLCPIPVTGNGVLRSALTRFTPAHGIRYRYTGVDLP